MWKIEIFFNALHAVNFQTKHLNLTPQMFNLRKLIPQKSYIENKHFVITMANDQYFSFVLKWELFVIPRKMHS